MTKFYTSYFWKEGIPYGIKEVDEKATSSYKIVMDPYRKHIVIEEYSKGRFVRPIYDSALLDFRKLKPREQYAWQKTTVEDTPEKTVSLIRNQDDCVVLIETYTFERGLCRACRVASPHGYPLSIQQMSYKCLGDPFNGVVLRDVNDQVVMYKYYEADTTTGEFTSLITEEWHPRENPVECKGGQTTCQS